MHRLLGLLSFLIVHCSPVMALPAEVPSSVYALQVHAKHNENSMRNHFAFLFEQEGFLLTSYQNITEPDSGQLLTHLQVKPIRGVKTYPATIVGVEPTIGLAILQYFPDQTLKAAQTTDIEAMVPGEVLYAVDQNITGDANMIAGRLSGLNTRECYQQSMTSTMFRAEMPLKPSAIGSPIFNEKGEVVAIYTGYKPPNIDGHKDNTREIHLLPIQLAHNIYQSLKLKKSMRSPWTGFSVMRLNAKQHAIFPTNKGDKGGVAIEAVWENSPAERLGIRPGDILVRFGHYRIESPADFQKWLYMYGVGETVRLVLIRDEQYQIHQYTIEERPAWAVPQ